MPQKTLFQKYQSKILITALAVLTVLVFQKVRHFDFVDYDDPEYVTQNHHVLSGLSLKNIKWALGSTVSNHWHPLTWISHMTDCELWGKNASYSHLTNVMLHLFNTILLFLLLRSATGHPLKSAVVAALFAVHPLHVESVAWISERKDVLSTLFWMLTLMSYVHYTRNPKVKNYLLVFGCLFLGLLAKPMLVTLPFVFLLFDYWPLGRTRISFMDPSASNVKYISIRQLVLEKIPFLGLAIASSMVTWIIMLEGGTMRSLTDLTLSQRLSNALVSYIRYMVNMFWPFDLAAFYPLAAIPEWKVLGAVGLLGVISTIAIVYARKWPFVIIGWLWYLGTLTPVIGIVHVGAQSIADRYTYIPLTGLFILLVWGVDSLYQQSVFNNRLKWACSMVLIILFSVSSSVQLNYWKNSEMLFGQAIKNTKNNFVGYNGLGLAALAKENYTLAFEYFKKSLEYSFDYVEAHVNMGVTLTKLNRVDDAITHFDQAIQSYEKDKRAHFNMGVAKVQTGKEQEAIKHFNKALQLDPEYEDALVNLGILLSKTGQGAEAVKYLNAAQQINPVSADIYYNLGMAYAENSQWDQSQKSFEKALKIRPDFIQARDNLNYINNRKRNNEAVNSDTEKLLKAIRKNPTDAALYYHLGSLYIRNGNIDEAIEPLKKALEINSQFTEALNSLAIAYTIQKNYEKAAELFNRLVTLLPDNIAIYYSLACVHALQNNTAQSIQWLKNAIEKGFNNWDLVKQDPKLENIRNTDAFKSLIPKTE